MSAWKLRGIVLTICTYIFRIWITNGVCLTLS